MSRSDWLAKRNRDRLQPTAHLTFMPESPRPRIGFTVADKEPELLARPAEETYPDLSPEDVADMRSGLLASRLYL